MRKTLQINQNWKFTMPQQKSVQVDIPHTWNGHDGQDGGDDYLRTRAVYEKSFPMPEFDKENEVVYLQFHGVNSETEVALNGTTVMTHEGGYSTFRADVTALLAEENLLAVKVDNSPNDRVYPQKADFTFYGGIYRDVELLIVSKYHFDLDYYSGPGIQIAAKPVENYKKGQVQIKTWHNAPNGQVTVSLLDAAGKTVASSMGTDVTQTIENVRLWNGLKDPYLYTCKAELEVDGKIVDAVTARFGVRDYSIDPKTGFFLNGKAYPLRGTCRHQDRPGIGNALTKEMHAEDLAIIKELGANTIRLAHYQHDQYFYDLCDEAGFVVWAEIPYISEHKPGGRENTILQMKELIVQNFNHPSICVWGLSNEITISTRDKKDMLDNHRMLNDLVHQMDPTRLTTLACYAVCGPFNQVAHITDVVSWNLYLGWYTPFPWLNDLWMWFFHKVYPNRALGYSEYGAEAMPNLHSSRPRRGDHTEEYQCVYHEYMLRCFDRHPWLWATHNWNTFDFAADARDQGGEPGMNHKGLVTFDRKTKKDAFYLYQAWWTEAPMVHICSKRYVNRAERTTTVKVYSNQQKVALYVDGKLLAEKSGDKVFTFRIPLQGTVSVKAVAGDCEDHATICRAQKPDPSYKLQKTKSKSANWV